MMFLVWIVFFGRDRIFVLGRRGGEGDLGVWDEIFIYRWFYFFLFEIFVEIESFDLL